MRMMGFAGLTAAAVALSGCIDVDLTATITGADSASVDGFMAMDAQMLQMMGGGENFCNEDEGGTLTMTETVARCDMHVEGSFAEVFEAEPGEPAPTAVDQGDGTVLVTFPIGQMTADSAEMRNDPQAVAMMGPMLEGHSFTIRVAGAEIVSTNGELAEDGLSASYTLNLSDILDEDFSAPETFETLVRY